MKLREYVLCFKIHFRTAKLTGKYKVLLKLSNITHIKLGNVVKFFCSRYVHVPHMYKFSMDGKFHKQPTSFIHMYYDYIKKIEYLNLWMTVTHRTLKFTSLENAHIVLSIKSNKPRNFCQVDWRGTCLVYGDYNLQNTLTHQEHSP